MIDYIPHGALEDTRSPEEKAKDHTHEEHYGGLPATWTEKPQSSWFLPSQRNQGSSFSCVAQASATAIESIIQNIESAAIYELRKGGLQTEGMVLQDCGDILYNTGTILESVTPSQNMNENQMNGIVLPSTFTVKATGYRTIGAITIDAVAEAVQAYGNCVLVFSSNTQEWTTTPIYLGTPTTFGHAICAVDFTLINGTKTLVCRDSAGQFSSPTGVRLITEDFLNKRCRGALYYLGAKPIIPPPPPTPSIAPFLTNLRYGMTSPEVARLQGALRQLGYFTYPEDTGYYGGLTQAAVLEFQYNTNVVTFGIESLFGFFFGPKSRMVLNGLLGLRS